MKHLILIITIFAFFTTNVHAKTHYKKHTHKHSHTKHAIVQHVANKAKHALIGIASWYGYESGPHYRRRPRTANGEFFSPYAFTAAHKTLPFGTKVRVTNTANDEQVLVTINDRGPFIKNRIIDLTKAAAMRIHFKGTQKVKLELI